MFRASTATGLALVAGFAVAQEGASPPLRRQKEKTSYALGMEMGKNLMAQSLDVDADLVARGLRDALTGGRTLLTEGEAKATISALQTELRAKQMQAARQLAEKNKREGEAFLAENKGREGVVTRESGLQYRILKAGDGKKPVAADIVVCHYRVMFVDGREFDSSRASNQPATFAVSRAIKGWQEVLQLMPVGSTWQLFVPPDLAYGERGLRREIGPNTTLIFEVELISIQDQPPTKAAQKSP